MVRRAARWSASTLREEFKPACVVAGRVAVEAILFATWFRCRLRRLLGHKSLETVRIYLAFTTEELERRHFELSPVRQVVEAGLNP